MEVKKFVGCAPLHQDGWMPDGRPSGTLGSARPASSGGSSTDVPGRTKTPIAVGEVDSLRAFLDFHRATLLWKVGGLSREELSRPMTPSGTNLLGMVKHLAYVERYWFGVFFAGLDLPMPGSDEDPDADVLRKLTDGATGD
jgi:hypothetical protein